MICEHGCTHLNEHETSCTNQQCAGCLPYQTDPTMRVCDKCLKTFDKKLVQLATLWLQLDNNLAVSTRTGILERVTTSFNHPTSLNLTVSDLKTQMREWLVFVYRVIVTETTVLNPPLGNSTLTLIAFVRRYILWLGSHELAADLVSDVQELVSRIANTVDPQKVKRVKIRTRTCTQTVEEAVCGGVIHAVIKDKQTLVACKSDRTHKQSMTAWMAEAGDLDDLVTSR